jgi:hypothetical protein
MNNGVASPIPTHNPKNSAAASQQGTEVLLINQDSAADSKRNHLLWGGGGIKLIPQRGVTIHPIEEVVKGIQQR